VVDALGGQRVATLRAPLNTNLGATASAVVNYDKNKTTKGRAGNVTSVAFSPDGTELLTTSGNHLLHLWRTSDWKLKTSLSGHNDEVWDARYSPNGRYAVSGAWDNTARVWNLTEQRLARTIPAHVSDVWAVAFSPDGQLITSGGGDRKVKFWDVAIGTLVQEVSGELHTAEVENLAFSPDGKTLTTVSRDGSLRFWRVPTPDDRVDAYARYELEKWSRKGEFEKSDEHQKRLTRSYDQLQQFKDNALSQMLGAYGNTANWESFTLGAYNADTETYTLTSAMWSGAFRVKVPPRDAARFREMFGKRTFGAPDLAFKDGLVTLRAAPVTVPFGTEARAFSITR